MNCKPGDLAYITHPLGAGKLVEVCNAAPPGSFVYPDGVLARNDYPTLPMWVIHSLGAPFPREWGLRIPHVSMYGQCHDKWLRPIPPLEEPVTVGKLEGISA